MRLGVITQYKINYDSYGIKVLRIFPEMVIKNPITRKYKYYNTIYYIKCNNRLWFVDDATMNTEIAKRKRNCILAIALKKQLLIKFNAG